MPASLLLEYDQNIVRHTISLNERRISHGDKPLRWKYFQYLALLFTEIYLDRYFRNPVALRTAFATSLPGMNEGREASECITGYNSEGDPEGDLNKLAFSMATGSGKTLLMHANILQYRHYIEKAGRKHELNRIILLTPNEDLSRQYLREFEAPGITAEIFDKEGSSVFVGHSVEIAEITRLVDERDERVRSIGERGIFVQSFEINNLVLVDEGHRGAAADEEGAWMRYRDTLCGSGFYFEYSATFPQALWFGRHLYQPLMYSENGRVEMSPVALNKGEREFVQDLRSFCDNNADYLAGKELYLLRNLSKGRGVGFFEAGNFHPDFILWLLIEGKQHVIFTDPKGLRNVDGMSDPKIRFHATIKDIERRLGVRNAEKSP